MVAHRRSIRGRTVRTNNPMDGSGGCDRAVWLASMTAAPSSWSFGEKEGTMAQVIASVPTSFDVQPFAGRWFPWTDIGSCFWPGRGRRAADINPDLAPVRTLGGYTASHGQPLPHRSLARPLARYGISARRTRSCVAWASLATRPDSGVRVRMATRRADGGRRDSQRRSGSASSPSATSCCRISRTACGFGWKPWPLRNSVWCMDASPKSTRRSPRWRASTPNWDLRPLTRVSPDRYRRR